MTSIFGSKTFNIIISFCVAFFLWFYVITLENPVVPQTISDVKVSLLNLESLEERGLIIVGDEEAFTIDVVVEGTRSDLKNKEALQTITATADVYGFGRGTNHIPVSVVVPDGLTFRYARPANIEVNIERKVAVMKPVRATFEGDLDELHEVGNIEASPSEISVSGAESIVGTVSYLRAVIKIESLGAEKREQIVELVPVNNAGEVVEGVVLEEKRATISAQVCEVKEVPLIVEAQGNVPSGYELENIIIPDTIKIKGPADILANVTQIQGSNILLSSLVESGNVKIDIDFPEEIEPANGYETVYANVTISKMESKTLTYMPDDIIINGISSELTAEILTESVSVEIVGTRDAINDFGKTDLSLSVDMSSITGPREGTFTLISTYTKSIESIRIVPLEITVRIQNNVVETGPSTSPPVVDVPDTNTDTPDGSDEDQDNSEDVTTSQ